MRSYLSLIISTELERIAKVKIMVNCNCEGTPHCKICLPQGFIIDDGSPKDNTVFSVAMRSHFHKQMMIQALTNLRAAKAAMIMAASIAWINTNPMATRRIDECIEMLEGYEKNA